VKGGAGLVVDVDKISTYLRLEQLKVFPLRAPYWISVLLQETLVGDDVLWKNFIS
jgi:hypothetical protein